MVISRRGLQISTRLSVFVGIILRVRFGSARGKKVSQGFRRCVMRLSRFASIALLLIPVVVFAQHSSPAGATASSRLSSASPVPAGSSSAGSYAAPNSAARFAEDPLASNTTTTETKNKKLGETVPADDKKLQKKASAVATNQSCTPTPACPLGSILGEDGRCITGLAATGGQCPTGQSWDGFHCKAPVSNCTPTNASLKSGVHK
jgi:hypothetical protein